MISKPIIITEQEARKLLIAIYGPGWMGNKETRERLQKLGVLEVCENLRDIIREMNDQ